MFDQERLEHLLTYLVLRPDEVQNLWYRARMSIGDAKFTVSEMGPPGLQAADLVAGQLRTMHTRWLRKERIEGSMPFDVITDAGIVVHGGFVMREDMEKWIAQGADTYLPE